MTDVLTWLRGSVFFQQLEQLAGELQEEPKRRKLATAQTEQMEQAARDPVSAIVGQASHQKESTKKQTNEIQKQNPGEPQALQSAAKQTFLPRDVASASRDLTKEQIAGELQNLPKEQLARELQALRAATELAARDLASAIYREAILENLLESMEKFTEELTSDDADD